MVTPAWRHGPGDRARRQGAAGDWRLAQQALGPAPL